MSKLQIVRMMAMGIRPKIKRNMCFEDIVETTI
jgi:hypothetical protein